MLAQLQGFSTFEAAQIAVSVAIIAFCYLLTLFNGYRRGPGPGA